MDISIKKTLSTESNGDEISGLLYKRRGGFGKHLPNAWQLRYFTIKDGVMYYYEGEEDNNKHPRGKIDLKSENCTLQIGIPLENPPSQYTMQIVPGGWDEKWKLCAENEDSYNKWVTVMQKHVSDKTKRIPPPLNLQEYAGSDDEHDDKDSHSGEHPSPNLLKRRKSVNMSPHDRNSKTPSINGNATPATPSTPATSLTTENVEKSSTPQQNINTPQDITPLTLSTTTSTTSHSQQELQSPPIPLKHQSSFPEKTAVKKAHSKKKLKLKTDTTEESDQQELLCVMIILNLCLFFGFWTNSVILRVIYVVIANVVVFQTLKLRAGREKASAAAATAAALASIPPTVTHHVSQVVHQATSATLSGEGQNNLITTSSTISQTVTSEVTVNEAVEGESVLEKDASGLIIPGQTLEQVIGGNPPDVPTHSWNICDYSLFNVRIGPDYNKYKKKAPSDKPLYDAFAVDIFCAKNRIDNVSRYMKLPDTSQIDTHNPYVPPILVIQIQIPSEAPPLFGTMEDGPGWAIVMYFKIAEHTCEQLKNLETASPAVKLFAKYCEKAESDPAWRARFKVINYCSNLEEMGVPSVIMSYNAKPVLIRKTGSIFRGKNYLEINIHVHKFANLAKKSIHALSSRCGLMYMQIGFVVEGREDDELPETLFACVGVNRPQEERGEFLFDDQEN